MTGIEYVTGDATRPQVPGQRIIAHVCNDLGGWGSGFVLALSARWPQPEEQYRAWHESGRDFSLGHVQLVDVGDGIIVANMIAQHGTIQRPARDGLPPVRYGALADCLRTVGQEAARTGASVHMPRIGCGLAGGRWDVVGVLVDHLVSRQGVRVVVYDLPPAEATS